jgi:hypothetical protein
MDLGSAIVAWDPYRGWVGGEVVWTGSQLINPLSSVSMSSSLVNDGGYRSAAPAKPNGPGGGARSSRGSGLVQAAIRA